MNDRQRFLATMHYQPRDRVPLCDFSFWDDTIVAWHDQGLPAHIDRTNSDEFFGMDPLLNGQCDSGVEVGLCPAFEERVIEDRGDREIVQQADGVRVLRRKFMVTIPQHLDHLLIDRESWREHYLPRLDPSHPDRLPADWEARVAAWRDPDRQNLVHLPGGSLYGKLRDWMGMENISLALYDDPAWFEEMVTTVADCILGTLERALASGVQFDALAMWEDMCYRSGPLISPRHFTRYLVPHYRRISDLARSHGIDVLWLDCDGNIDRLLPLWLEAGINCMFPIEVGPWGADPVRYRRQYGRDLLMMGGFSKHILAESKDAIIREVERLAPLVEEGGYLGFCDHRVPPNVPLENYVFYLETVRDIWGHGANLKPMGALDPR